MFTNITEENFFISHLNKTQTVLEYGSGASTAEIANRVQKIVSLEHQKVWYNWNKKRIPDNCTLIFKTPNLPYQEGTNCGTYDEFKDYIEAPLLYTPFDIILIDGRARVACSSICKLLGHSDTLVFIHDYHRVEYHEVLKYLTLVETCDTMAKLKIIF